MSVSKIIVVLLGTLFILGSISSCEKEPEVVTATCVDGVQNGDETGIDCGGATCPACPTCEDGIQNQGEGGIDCGGPCALMCYSSPVCNVPANTLTENGDVIALLDSFDFYIRSSGLYNMDAYGPGIWVNLATVYPKIEDGNYTVVEGYGPLDEYVFSIAVIFDPDNGYDLFYAEGGTIHLKVGTTETTIDFCDVVINAHDANTVPQQYTLSGNIVYPN